jgi:Protein of unknown function (DUF2462)
MAQGQHKAKSSSLLARQAQKKKGTVAARGIRIAPKDAGLIAQKRMQKRLSSRNIAHTESVMAAKAGATGKLTIMKKIADSKLEQIRKESKDKK